MIGFCFRPGLEWYKTTARCPLSYLGVEGVEGVLEVKLIVVTLGWPWRSSWRSGTRTILRLANAHAHSSTKGN